MPDYKSMYFTLFNSVTDAIERLKQTQVETEEMYIESEDDTPPKTETPKP